MPARILSAANVTLTMWQSSQPAGPWDGSCPLTELIRLVRERDGVFLTLEVRESNAPARSLYGKLGFSEAGRRRGFYSEPREGMRCFSL